MKPGLNWVLIFGGSFAFDKDKLVILLNGFIKKAQKTPKKQIEKAVRLMKEYYEEKNKDNGN